MDDKIFNDAERKRLAETIAQDSVALNCRRALLNRRQIAALLGYRYSALAPILKDPSFPKPVFPERKVL